MKSFFTDVIGTFAAGVLCVIAFAFLQWMVLSEYIYDVIRGSDS